MTSRCIKKQYLPLFFILSFLFLTEANCFLKATEPSNPNETPKRLKRSESFFGVHFDFHAGKTVQNIGATTTSEMVQAIIDALHPDFIQVDSKGHPGLTSYPTKVGNPAPGVTTDALKIWREVTARNGVALYTHYSGVWDTEAVAQHPEWAVINAVGSRSDQRTSVFGDYKNQLLVPQILEMALEYGTDGVWVDGECWATILDYSDKAKEKFKQATDRENIPTSPDQDGWKEWYEFHQESFRQYLRNYVDEIKGKAPNFQIASNWAFTDHMPEPVSANVDFISGDYSPDNSINAARYSTRLMSTQNKAWDLMAWSFGSKDGVYGNWAQKTGVQLSREAACVLAQGGSFQAYITQNPDGAVNLEKLPAMAETSKFCRARQVYCQYSTGVPQVALYCPTEQHYHNTASSGTLFPMITWQRPILSRLLELNYCVDIRIDQTLTKTLSDLPVIVFYRGGFWSEDLKKQIGEYVNNGGSIVLIGNEPLEEIRTLLSEAKEISSENVNEKWFLTSYSFGKGKIVVFPTPVDSPQEFIDANGPTFNQYLEKAMKQAFDKPLVQLAQKQPLDVSVRRTQEGKLAVHFVNVSGPHEQAGIIESIDPVNNVDVTLNLVNKPKSIRLEPSNVKLDFTWENGQAQLLVPSVPIHEILIVDE